MNHPLFLYIETGGLALRPSPRASLWGAWPWGACPWEVRPLGALSWGGDLRGSDLGSLGPQSEGPSMLIESFPVFMHRKIRWLALSSGRVLTECSILRGP